MTKRPKILQIFNRYLDYGGEEGSVGRIALILKEHFELDTYYCSTDQELNHPLGRLRMPFLMQKNRRVLNELMALQSSKSYDIWQIHNVFPAASVAVYSLAEELGVPIVQYLHNYRFGCAAASYFREGSLCNLCKPDDFSHALKYQCWRGSRVATASMVWALRSFWKQGSGDSIQRFIAISEAQKAEHVKMGITADRIEVIHHFLEAGEAAEGAVAKEGEVLFIGRIAEEKGLALLLEAWGKADTGRRTLRIVGDGPDLPAMKNYVEANAIEHVRFEGFVPREEHDRFWSKASFFVAPSVWKEPFGMVVLEAWRKSMPVLASNLGSFPELIDDGVNGWLAEPTRDGFVKGLERALSDDVTTMGVTGRAKLEDRFDKSSWMSKIVRVYESFAEGGCR